jgi:predicted nucleic acid-binding protein
MRYVIALDTALRLFRERINIPIQNGLVAPTLLRSQALSHLYASVLRGEIDRKEAASQLDHMRTLKIRLLGDRVLQKVAWDIAEQLRWKDTFAAEYVALARLQADAFVTLDDDLARSVKGIVPLASFEELLTEQRA